LQHDRKLNCLLHDFHSKSLSDDLISIKPLQPLCHAGTVQQVSHLQHLLARHWFTDQSFGVLTVFIAASFPSGFAYGSMTFSFLEYLLSFLE
jgi:hypothetical protein